MREFEGYRRGINFGGWLSQCEHTKEHYDGFISAADFAKVKALGYDHVRLPIDYELIETEDGTFIEDGFSYIAFAVAQCRENGLKMVLDLHRTPGFSFDPAHNKTGLFGSEELQSRFYAIWRELAARFASESDVLAFELLNEVTEKEFMPKWNEMMLEAIRIIRGYSKDIFVIAGGYYNNSVEAVGAIAEPVDDRIVYTFHFYEPLLFTHQGAYWIPSMDLQFRCPFYMTYGEYIEKSERYLAHQHSGFDAYDADALIGEEYFEDLIAGAVAVARERNVPLYCGEFGVIDRADRAEAAKWFELFYRVLDRYSIAGAIWSYRQMDFSVVD